MRLILYVGKGGVGKTTVAAATAVRAAERGQRTLIVSANSSHGLGDVLGADLGTEPTKVLPSLYAEEINILDQVERHWGKVQHQLGDLLRQQDAPNLKANEIPIAPGMDEVIPLIALAQRIRAGGFDCIVVDAASTGETIRLLNSPDSLQWYADRILEWRSRLPRLAGPLLRGALPDLSILDLVAQGAASLRDLRDVLTDSDRSSYRLVLTPDQVVLKESRRAETFLNILGYPVDAVIVNRLLVAETGPPHPFVDALVARHQATVTDICRAYAPLPVLQGPLWSTEPIGVSSLAAFAQKLFGDRDPTEVLHVVPVQQVEPTENGYVLRIRMPNVEASKLSIRKRRDALFIDVANYRRALPLPRALIPLEPTKARLKDGVLEIPFGPGNGHVTRNGR